MKVRWSEATTVSETMDHPVDGCYKTLSARALEAIRNGQHVSDVLSAEERQELDERHRAYSGALKRYNQELRESLLNEKKEMKRNAMEALDKKADDLWELWLRLRQLTDEPGAVRKLWLLAQQELGALPPRVDDPEDTMV